MISEVVGIFPREAAIVRLVGAIMLEQNGAWPFQTLALPATPERAAVTPPDRTRHV